MRVKSAGRRSAGWIESTLATSGQSAAGVVRTTISVRVVTRRASDTRPRSSGITTQGSSSTAGAAAAERPPRDAAISPPTEERMSITGSAMMTQIEPS